MARPDTDPCQVVSDLIVNAAVTAGVLGENHRITSLVAGTVRRLLAEMDAQEGDRFSAHVRECLMAYGVENIPVLTAELQAILESRA